MKTKNEYRYILQWYQKNKSINLLGGKCQNCGEDRPWLLSFHHKNPEEKEFTISEIKNYKWAVIKNEILKCELLCHNCHRQKHNQQKDTIDTQNKKILLEMKSISGCEICGYNDYIGALDFHHEKDKKFQVPKIRYCEKSCEEVKNKIVEEVSKCQVLCANCHQDLHFDKEKFEKYKEEIDNWKYVERPIEVNKEKAIEMFQQGMKQTEIAKKLKCSKSTICGIIKKYARVAKWESG